MLLKKCLELITNYIIGIESFNPKVGSSVNFTGKYDIFTYSKIYFPSLQPLSAFKNSHFCEAEKKVSPKQLFALQTVQSFSF